MKLFDISRLFIFYVDLIVRLHKNHKQIWLKFSGRIKLGPI